MLKSPTECALEIMRGWTSGHGRLLTRTTGEGICCLAHETMSPTGHFSLLSRGALALAMADVAVVWLYMEQPPLELRALRARLRSDQGALLR